MGSGGGGTRSPQTSAGAWSLPAAGRALLAVRGGGGPFTAWPTVFERVSGRIRDRFEPRFPRIYREAYERTAAVGGLMPATVRENPLGISCVVSDGRRGEFTIGDVANPQLARDCC